MLRRSIQITTLAVIAVLAGAGASSADPGTGAGQSTYPMVCDDELTMLTMGGGSWSAADLHEGGKFVPESTHFTIQDPSGEVLYEEYDWKNGGAKGTSSCVDELEIDGLYYRFLVTGKMQGNGSAD